MQAKEDEVFWQWRKELYKLVHKADMGHGPKSRDERRNDRGGEKVSRGEGVAAQETSEDLYGGLLSKPLQPDVSNFESGQGHGINIKEG